MNKLSHDGRWVYVLDVDDDNPLEMVDLIPQVCNYCVQHDIMLVLDTAEVRDEATGKITIKYQIGRIG